ncbi:FtsW/RodA/SpoVE family cell cycle protein [Candidatus Woesebacteria bacterium]|nr:FtsW/RodA/SpoVE family cell cycle protein [Candidatus Woesebacteria bacterium]QQG47140.1 MAG: FtsW/RodA/SpoVE family cell cycle protein [Candidatus Woesebacteria bacterium]
MRVAISVLIILSIITLRAIYPSIFPNYFLYIIISIVAFICFSRLDFEILEVFYKHFYVISVVLLIITLLIGQATRGVVRWIPLGPINFQPTEIARPFLLLFFAKFLSEQRITIKRFILALILFAIPFLLIWFQPSLGVAVVTTIGIIGITLTTGIEKRIILISIITVVALLPIIWQLLRPYQKTRIIDLLNSGKREANYNSLQSMISVGSGEINGRGLGKGAETQLYFLPERHTDFIFASISEELGTVGSMLVILTSFYLLYQIIIISESTKNIVARTFAIGIFMTLFMQTFVHIGMNMGLTPVTGLPLPLVSAGGSSLVATMASYGMLLGIKRNS